MNTLIYKIFLILIFFFSFNVMCFYNIDANPIFAGYLVVGFALLFHQNSEARHNYFVFFSTLSIICFGLYKVWTDESEGARFMSLNIMLPIVLYAAMPYYSKEKNHGLWNSIKFILLTAFIIEVGLAFCERIFMYNIFPHVLSDETIASNIGQSQYSQIIDDMTDDKLLDQEDLEVFRSLSLYGHPLQNALIVSTIMTFILFSNMNMKKKMPLWMFGYIAILCFNSRSSIIINFVIFIIYLIQMVSSHKKRSNDTVFLIFFTIIISGSIVYLMNTLRYGGRLISMGLLDESSAKTRIDTWRIFDNYELSDFLYGHTFEEINNIYLVTDIIATENFWIDWLLRYGLFFILGYIVIYYFILKRLYENYPISVVIITFMAFIIHASTNNSLSVSWLPMFVFLLCIKVFDPSNKIIN